MYLENFIYILNNDVYNILKYCIINNFKKEIEPILSFFKHIFDIVFI